VIDMTEWRTKGKGKTHKHILIKQKSGSNFKLEAKKHRLQILRGVDIKNLRSLDLSDLEKDVIVPPASTHKELLKYPKQLIVAKKGNKVIGMMFISHQEYGKKPYTQIDFIHVSPKIRKLGLGRKLVESAVQDSVERGYSGRVRALPTPDSKKFYERLGFKFVSARIGTYALKNW